MNRKSVFRLTAAIVLFAFAADAASWRYWKTGDGDWTDPARWEDGYVPISGDIVVQWRSGRTGTANVNTNVTVNYWDLADASVPAAAAVTWTGNGTITNTSTSTASVGRNRRLVIDGPDVYQPRLLKVSSTNASVTVRRGQLYVGTTTVVESGSAFAVESGRFRSSEVEVRSNATFTVSGGTAVVGSFAANSNATVTVSGGTLQFNGAPSLPAAAFTFTGGTVRWSNTSAITLARFHLLPPAGAVLETRNSSYEAFYINENGTSSFDGTIVATNRATGTPGMRFYKKSYTFSGKGTMLVDQLYINNGYTVTLKIGKLCLGKQLACYGSSGAAYSFPEGMTFGAWGDWRNVRTDNAATGPSIYLAGDVSFETRDCIDGKTPRTIRLIRCVDTGLRSLSVTGGGIVDLSFADGLDGLETLSVGEGTTLVLTNTATTVSVRDLEMAAASRILLAAGKGALEPINEPNLAPDAEIVFDASAPAAGKLHPVWTGLFGVAMPDNVVIEGLDSDVWTLKTVNGVSYLSDGTVTNVTSTDQSVWLGTNSSLWSVKANWKDGFVLSGSTYGYFCREANLFVTNDVARSLRYPVITANAGPYFFAGKQLTLMYGANKDTSNSIRHGSDFPAVFENRLVGSAAHVYFRSLSDAPLCLVGGGSSKGIFYIHGDVRFGGAWTGTNIVLNAQGDAFRRPSRITVLEGGTFTLTAADGTLAAPARLRIDGVFETSNTLVSVATEGWRGTGAVKLHGVDTSETAAFTLGDGLTLYPQADWVTAGPDAPGAAVTVAVTDTPTLGATRDWTYGPAAGAEPTTAAADRALTVAADATLTIDTEDPVTGDGHVVTFADPILADGDIVKTGAGTLRFATTASRVAGTFTVAEGRIAPDAALAARADRAWTPLVTAGAFDGLDAALPATLKYRLVSGADGLLTCEVRTASGFSLILR